MNLYVGNIPWSTSEEELESHFAQYGNVNAVRIITEGHSGRSKGFGFVEMESKEDFPEPERPVITTRLSLGRSTSIFLRLFCFAPLTLMCFII